MRDPVGTEALPLFADPARRAGEEALARAEAKNEETIQQLIPIARSLAWLAYEQGEEGITVSDLRLAGMEKDLIDGTVKDRSLSYLGAVMKRAGLRNTGRRRRSGLEKTHGNLQTVWAWQVNPQDPEGV